jgi:hypothetical protein
MRLYWEVDSATQALGAELSLALLVHTQDGVGGKIVLGSLS